jgi:hypothetical protein
MVGSVSRRAGRGGWLLAAFSVVALLCGTARAQVGEVTNERYRLRWVRESGAESCVSGAALARWLPQVVAPNASVAGSPVLLLDGVAEPAAPPLTFSVRISVRDAVTKELLGERELTTTESKCSALTPAVMLVLAMSVDPDRAQSGLPAAVQDELRRDREEDVDVWPAPSDAAALEPGPSPVAAAPPRVSVAPARAAATRPVVSRGRTAELRSGLALSHHVQPKLSPGLMLGGTLAWSEAWSASLAALGWLPRTAAIAPSAYALDDGVDFDAVQLALSLCRRLVEWGPGRAEACAGAQLGLRWLSARALANKNNPVRPFFGPELGLAATLTLGAGWSLRTGVDATLSLRDDRFTYEDHLGRSQLLFEPGLFSGRALLGVGRQL